MTGPQRRIRDPVLFICDLQEKFKPAIHEFQSILTSTQKLLKAAKILGIPILATTQQRAKLGQTCSELELGTTYPLLADVDKSAFSMWVPDVVKGLKSLPKKAPDVSRDTAMKGRPFDIIIVGIETHICVLQTTLDAIANGNRVWIVQDAVSSCNPEERPIALERLRQEGARITTTESLIYELMGDSEDAGFKQIAGLVKETKESTKAGLKTLCNI